MHDRFTPKWMSLWSRDLLKFWEITDNISETVQHSDIVTMEDQQEMIRGLLNGTNANDLE